MRRTKAEAAETRETILDAAEAAFLEHGVSQTSLNQIAAYAGVTRGAIYFHFKDKVDIYRAMLERIRFPEEELMDKARQNVSVNPLDILQNSAMACLQRFVDDEQQQRVVTIITQKCEYVGDFSNALSRLREAHTSMLNLFERMFRVALERNMLSPNWQPRDAAHVMVSMVGGLINEWLQMDKSFDLVHLGSRLIENQINALRQ